MVFNIFRGGLMNKVVKALLTVILFVIPVIFLNGNTGVQTVDFLALKGLKTNGAGPLLTMADNSRNRVVLVNTNTSSVSIIEGPDHKVRNIPIKTRVPQYLKAEAAIIDGNTGNIYIIGTRSLHIVFPEDGSSKTVDTGQQYEMVAVNEANGDAFLVGRASKVLLRVRLKSLKPEPLPWVDHVENLANLNQTPPPPIRKVVCDNKLQRVVALDGFTHTLYLFSAKRGKLLKKRTLNVKGGTRWHTAGYDQATHHLYTVIETAKRSAIEAIKIDIINGNDVVVPLPGLTEAVGVTYNPSLQEVYIPYDNHPSLHVVDFKPGSAPHEIAIPTYGNDATAIDIENNRLYISCWGYGDVEVVDLKKRRFIKAIKGVGILPHMFNMVFHPGSGHLMIPIGATAVNGSFGASLTALDPVSEKKLIIRTGWSPVALVELEGDKGFMVFNSEDEVAVVSVEGKAEFHQLPDDVRFVNNAIPGGDGVVIASYGPHQSYWPTVYIWAAKNGILTIDPTDMTFYDRRTPRLAHQMVKDKNGALYALQNNWGGEAQFLVSFPDNVRFPNLGNQRLELPDQVVTETTQRILKYDEDKNWLYIVRVGESNAEPGILQIYDLAGKKLKLSYPTGLTPTDLIFDGENIYIANFDSDTVTAVAKEDFSVQRYKTGEKPFKLALLGNDLYCINHNGKSLQVFKKAGGSQTYPLPHEGKSDNIFANQDKLIITGHSESTLYIDSFDPKSQSFETIHKSEYPFGETTVDTDNSSFYLRGQFGDGIFELNQIKQDKRGRLWITDYLSGKLFIIKGN